MDTNATNSDDSHSALIGRSNRKRFLLIPVLAVFNFLLPPLILLISTPGALLTALLLAMFFVPLGVVFLLIGVAYLQLRIEILGSHVRLALPYAETEPWFPWLLQRVSVPLAELQKLEIRHRYNAYAANETEKIAVLHTTLGAFQFNSIWFPKFDELVAALASECRDPNVISVGASQSYQPTRRERWIRLFARSSEIVGLGALMVLGILALSGQSERASTIIACMLLFLIARPAFQTLRNYRQAA